MQWIPLIILSFCLTGEPAGAQHFDPGIIHVIEDVNRQKPLPDYTKYLCSNLFVSNSENKSNSNSRDMNECVVSLCGIPSENKSVYLTDANFDQYISPNIKKELQALTPNLKKGLEITQKVNLELVNKEESAIFEKGILEVRPETWSEHFKQDLSYEIFSPYFTTVIDLKKPIAERFEIKLNPMNDRTPDFKKNLNTYAKQYEDYVKNNFLKFQEMGLYGEEELKTIAADKLQKLKNNFQSNPKAFNESESKYFNTTLSELENAINAQTSMNSYSVFSQMNYLEGEVGIHVAGSLDFSKAPSCSDSNSCNKIYQDYFDHQNLAKYINDQRDELNNPKSFDQALNRCKTQIIAKLSNASDKKTALKLVEEVKKQMDKNVFSKFSEHSRGILKDYFANQIKTQPSNLESLISSSDPAKNIERSAADFLKINYEPFKMRQEEALKNVLSIIKKPDEVNVYAGDESSPCGTKLAENAWDSYIAYDKIKDLPAEEKKLFGKLLPQDHLFISDFTCHHDLRGKSVVAHELGHAINQIFATMNLSAESSKFYKSLRQCATDNYVEFIADKKAYSQPNDGIRTEEDTADLFAYMTYSDEKDLFTCALIRPSLNNNSYAELSFDPAGSDHSTPLYRLVMEAINKDVPLPISCQKALEPQWKKSRLKKCIP